MSAQFPVGIFEKIVFDEAEDKIHVLNQQDVEPILEHNKRNYNEAYSGNRGYSVSRNMVRVASIPNVIIHDWFRKGINIFDQDDMPKICAMLDDPEYAFLRTAPGRLGYRPTRHYIPHRSRGFRRAVQLL